MPNSLSERNLFRHPQGCKTGRGDGQGGGIKKVLGVRDLTSMGIAAVIGAGIFSTIGQAAYDGGPGVFSFSLSQR